MVPLRALALLGAGLALSACGGREPRVAPGALVRLHYAVEADGKPTHTTEGGAPLSVRIGSGDLLPGVEARLMGRRAGEQVSFVLTPAEGFGPRDPAKVQAFERGRFGAQASALRVGDKVGGVTKAGSTAEGFVVALDAATVTLDFNPPLAGKTLSVRARLLEVRRP